MKLVKNSSPIKIKINDMVYNKESDSLLIPSPKDTTPFIIKIYEIDRNVKHFINIVSGFSVKFNVLNGTEVNIGDIKNKKINDIKDNTLGDVIYERI